MGLDGRLARPRRFVVFVALMGLILGFVGVGTTPAGAVDVSPTGLVALDLTSGLLQVNTGQANQQQFDLSPSDTPACSDGIDNNDAPPLNVGTDGFTDWPADPQCSSATDSSELAPGFQPLERVVVVPTVDAAGNLTLAKNVRASETEARTLGGIYFPPGYLPDATLGMITARFQPAPGANVNTPATGTINIDTGATSLTVPVRIKLEGGSGLTALGSGCYIPSGNNGISLDMVTGTTAPPTPNQPISGTPYNRYNGAVTLVNNSFSVGTAGTCGPLGLGNGSINDAFGLPAAGGRNAATFTFAASPRLNYLSAAPVANAGPDQFRHLDGSTVTLDASASTDANGDPIGYSWTQVGGAPVTLTNPTSAHPTFDGALTDDVATFQVTTSSRDMYLCPTLPELEEEEELPPECLTESSTDSVSVHFAYNVVPEADAGDDQLNISVGKTVTLDGSGSTDANLDTLSYSWTQVGGDPVVLNDASTATPSFTSPSTGPADFEFELTVNDGFVGGTDTDTVAVHVIANQAPVANAGPDQTNRKTFESVTLTAAGSTDADGHTLSYSWVQTGGHPVTLSNPTSASPTFVIEAAPDFVYPHALEFSVTVSDGFGGVDDDGVAVQVTATNPTVNGVTRAPSGTVFSGDTITLGALVTNPDGGALSYVWSQATGKTTSLSSSTVANPTFVLPANGTNAGACTSGTGATGPTSNNCPRFQVVVTNAATGASSGSPVALAAYASTAPTRPIANAGANQSAPNSGGLVTLHGSGTQAQSHPLTHAWTQTSGPAVTLSDPTAAQPTFDAPVGPATLGFELVVTDTQNPITSGANIRTSLPSSTTVNVVAGTVVASAGPDQTGRVTGQTVTLDGSGSTDPNLAPLSYSWTQVANGAPTVTLSDANAVQPTFVAPQVTTPGGYTVEFELTVTNGGVDPEDTDSDTVSVSVVRSTPTVTVSRAPSGTVFTGDVVTLSANITNPDGTNPADYTYVWTQISGRTTALSSTTATNPTYSVPTSGSSATAVCTSGTGTQSATSANCPRYSVVVTNIHTGAVSTVANLAAYGSTLPGRPVANAGPAQSVKIDTEVTLAGSGTQAQGRPLTYAWTQTAGGLVTLSDPTAPAPTFTAPSGATSLTFSLVVTDPLNPITTGNNQRTSLASTVVITVTEYAPPVADAGVDQTVYVGAAPVTLDASGSSQVDDNPLTYLWTQTSGDAVTLSSDTAEQPTFTAPGTAGELRFTVTVTDTVNPNLATNSSTSSEVTVTVVDFPTISGTITDTDDLPVEGVTVAAFSPTDGVTPTATTVTDASGAYTLTLPAGSYALSYSPPSGSGLKGEWFDDQTSRAAATAVVIAIGSSAAGVDAVLAPEDPSSTISGTVLDDNGDPLEGVVVVGVNVGTAFFSTITAADGTYTLTELSAGTYLVAFLPPGGSNLLTQFFDGAATPATATSLDLTEGGSFTGIDAELVAAPSINGTVTTTGGSPVGGVTVQAWLPGAFVPSYTTVTAGDGSYSLEGLAANTYQIRFLADSGSGLVSEFYNDVQLRGAATLLNVTAGAINGIDASLAMSSSISGTVTAGGEPVAGVGVEAWKPGAFLPSYTATTAANGTYSIPNAAPGSYQVRFVPTVESGLTARWYIDSVSRGGATPVVVNGGVAVVDGSLSVPSSISGVVTDGGGNPVAGVTVGAFKPGDTFVASHQTTTAADGTYTLTNVLPNSYQLRFGPPSGSGLAVQWYNAVPTKAAATPVVIAASQTITGRNAVLVAL